MTSRSAVIATPVIEHADQPARLLITGSRTWTRVRLLREVLDRWQRRLPGAVLVHGAARGADTLAAGLWTAWGLPVEAHPADWDHHGRSAGFRRNQHMVSLGADVCLAFIRNNSPGASALAELAPVHGIPTFVYRQED